MPKKHQPDYRASISHGSSSSQKPTGGSGPPKSVNERLEQLRREQTPRLSVQKAIEVNNVATQRTVPPHLRQILSIPETAPPLPKFGFRQSARRSAGPPPPQSWLQTSRHAPFADRIRAQRELMRTQRLRQQTRLEGAKLRQKPHRFTLMALLPDAAHPLPPAGSLTDSVLKTIAANWDWLAEFEQYNLPLLPASLRSSLFSYVSLFGPSESIEPDSIQLLLYSGSEDSLGIDIADLSQLDFTGLLSHELTLLDVTKLLTTTQTSINTLSTQVDALDLVANDVSAGEARSSAPSVKPAKTILESWEEENEFNAPTAVKSLKLPRFPHLTRLSLAHAGVYASWKQLLTLSVHLSTITHLSLAHWPIPSVTPNSKTAFVTSRHADISFGGSHYYSVLDEDWYEAANILRRLSKNTYCLQWIDLEGCNEWLPALTWRGSQVPPDRWADRTFQRDRRAPPPEPDMPLSMAHGPDWNESWSQVTFVNVAQGVIPNDITALRRLPSGLIACELLLYLRERCKTNPSIYPMDSHYDVSQWLEAENGARKVGAEVRLTRSRSGGKFCRFEYGWSISDAQSAVVAGRTNGVANG